MIKGQTVLNAMRHMDAQGPPKKSRIKSAAIGLSGGLAFGGALRGFNAIGGVAALHNIDRFTLLFVLGALSLLAMCAAIGTVVHFVGVQRRFDADQQARRAERQLHRGPLRPLRLAALRSPVGGEAQDGAELAVAHARLTAARFEWWQGDTAGPMGRNNGSYRSVLLADVIGADTVASSVANSRHVVTVHVMQAVQRSALAVVLDACLARWHWARRAASRLEFVAQSAQEAEAWAEAVCTAVGTAKDDGDGAASPPAASDAAATTPKRVLVIVNPVAGTQQGRAALARLLSALGRYAVVGTESESTVESQGGLPLSARGGVRLHLQVRETEHAGHGREIAATVPLSGSEGGFDGLVCIGGDGLLHEVVNGVLARAGGAAAAASLAFGIVPAGSGNGIAKSHGILPLDVETVALRLLQWRHRPLDVIEINAIAAKSDHAHMLPPSLFSIVSASYGIIADVDRESERFRWLGSLRFTLVALLKILEMPLVRARVSHGGAKKTPLDETSWIGIIVHNLPWITHDLK